MVFGITRLPVKLAIFIIRPNVAVGHTVTEPAHSYDSIYGKASHLLLSFLYKYSFPIWAEMKTCTRFLSHCTWVEILIRYQNYCFSAQPPLFYKYGQYLGFIVATDYFI